MSRQAYCSTDAQRAQVVEAINAIGDRMEREKKTRVRCLELARLFPGGEYQPFALAVARALCSDSTEVA